METFYRNLLPHQSSSVSEHKSTYVVLTERHLQAIWWEQRAFQNLKTAEGEQIQVLSPGIWNFNSGPDFIKAHLIINGKELKGDVEIHFTSPDWYHHRHHEDSRYNDVVLHVVLWRGKEKHSIQTHNQRSVIETFLEESLKLDIEKVAASIDLDLYPYQVFGGSGKCAQPVFSKLSEERVHSLFKSAAAYRLVKKYEYLSAWMEDASLFLGAGVAMALGYKNNTEAFLRLFIRLHPLRHHNEDTLLAYLMGWTGFFRSHFQVKWGNSDYYRHLYSLHLMNSLIEPSREKIELNCHQVRPLNHPLRRLATLVQLIRDPCLGSYFSKLGKVWSVSWRNFTVKDKTNHLKNKLLETLPSYEDSYWNYHYNFEVVQGTNLLPLMGESLKQEILVNTVFAVLYHEIAGRGNRDEIEAFFNLYGSFPEAKTSKLKYLNYRFFGNNNKGNILNKADLQQGAYQLHKDFCLHYEASCEGCPFVDTINKSL